MINMYIYSGTDRTNLTALIENNDTAAFGAPYLISIDDGVVIVAQAIYQAGNSTVLESKSGVFQFSF